MHHRNIFLRACIWSIDSPFEIACLSIVSVVSLQQLQSYLRYLNITLDAFRLDFHSLFGYNISPLRNKRFCCATVVIL